MYDEEDDERSEEERMSEKIMKRRFTCHKEAAIVSCSFDLSLPRQNKVWMSRNNDSVEMFFSLASAAGFTVRIVCRCQVITKKVPEVRRGGGGLLPAFSRRVFLIHIVVLVTRYGVLIVSGEWSFQAPDAKKKDEEKGPVKRRNNEKEQTRNHPIIDYWIEMWDEERDTWIG